MRSEVTLQQLRYIIEVAECGSINAAAQNLFVSQSSLSTSIKDTERELGIEVFNRSNRGITLTSDGIEFLGYARQVVEQVDLLERRYSDKRSEGVGRFAVSTQHYAFSLAAFIELCEEFKGDEYDFEFRETRTGEIIADTRTFRSELGILYLSNYNRKVLVKTFSDSGLRFTPLFQASPHVFVGEGHPLASKATVTPQDLEHYPRYSFEQGTENSFFYAEEPLSHLPHKRTIAISDRGTLSNLLTHHNGYTISTGVLSEEMNNGIVAIPLDSDEAMTVGYINHADIALSPLAERYVQILRERIKANPTVTEHFADEANVDGTSANDEADCPSSDGHGVNEQDADVPNAVDQGSHEGAAKA